MNQKEDISKKRDLADAGIFLQGIERTVINSDLHIHVRKELIKRLQ